MNNKPIITVNNLVKKFGNFVANDNLTFTVHTGEIFGFLGANGAGKTTAMKILCGLSRPTSGKIEVAGYNVYNQSDELKKNIGYMSQKFSLYEDLTIIENIRFYAGIYGIKSTRIKGKAGELLKELHLEKDARRLVSTLPLGWKQKLAFSIALIHDPQIVFLDEPTGGVDPITRRQFWDMIYEAAHRGVTVFVTTHYMDEAEYCDRVCVLVDGVIKALDTPLELKEQFKADSMDEVFVRLARPVKAEGV